MKINFMVRLQNKTFLLTFLVTCISFIYQLLGMFQIVPSISSDSLTQFVTMFINLMAAVGILVDPTTKGVSDSERVLTSKELGQ